MSIITRRSVLAAGASLALPGRSEVEAIDESPRPVFIPLARSPFPDGDVDTLNANLLEIHEGRVWAYDHRDNLPTDYDELDHLPANHRHAVLEALPVTTAVELVLERIRRCADADPYLTNEQRALLAGAPLTVTPEWCEASGDQREEKWPDGGFWQRTREAFEPEEWSRVFGSDDTGNTWPHARHLDLSGCVLAVGW